MCEKALLTIACNLARRVCGCQWGRYDRGSGPLREALGARQWNIKRCTSPFTCFAQKGEGALSDFSACVSCQGSTVL